MDIEGRKWRYTSISYLVNSALNGANEEMKIMLKWCVKNDGRW